MVSITIPMEDELQREVKHILWVNWSEVSEEELMKREIFEKYIRSGSISDDEWEFCERIDWHPVDELPYKEEFVKRILEAEKGKFKTTTRLDFWNE